MRIWLTLLFGSMLLIASCEKIAVAEPSSVQIKELTNLQTLSQQAKAHNLPIMLAFGAKWCEFCQMLREDVLNPMALSGNYEGKYMFMRYVSLDDRQRIPGMDGQPILKDDWATGYGVDLTPTVLFIDGNGKEVAPRIVG
ncbi:MAG: thioredoxin family protein, partial [Hydrogenovibrio sp.]|nr:thioredoxin family protein [Hydrogenovibrio sp.]